jgi:hypothetical protein
MKSTLPCLSLVLALVTSETGAEATEVTAGDRLLVQAISQLERHSSVTARLRHQVAIGGDQLYGVGSYWQQGSGENLRVRLELQIAGQESSLLQVSNSRFLWVDRRLPTGRTVTRVDLRQIRADPVLAAANLTPIEPGEASWSPIQPELTAECGGMASLLASLGENFSFLPPQAMRLAITPPLASEATNIPVFAVVGHWKPAKLAAIHPAAGPTLEDAQELPDRLPQEVLLLVGQADLFPYRIEYRKLETRPAARDGSSIPYQLSAAPLVVLEISDVSFDVQIQGGQFDYSPRDVDWKDHTANLLERLRKERAAQMAARDTAVQPR